MVEAAGGEFIMERYLWGRLVYELIREDIVIKLGARVDGEGEGEDISRGDAARHSRSGDIGGRDCKEGKANLLQIYLAYKEL